MIFLRAGLAAVRLNLASLRQRIWPALVVVVGVACVVATLLSMLSMTVGLRHTWQRAGSPERAIILPATAQREGDGAVSRAEAQIIKDAPGIARDARGRAIADPEITTGLVVRRQGGGRGNIQLRSFGPEGLALRPEFRIVAGRMYQPGKHEMVVGAEAPGQFRGVGLGDKITMPDGLWPVVGVFKTNDDLVQSQLVADSDTVMPVLRKTVYTSVTVRLGGADALAALKRSITTNPALKVQVERQSDYYNRRSAQFSDLNDALVYGVGVLLGLGALLAAVNILYSAVMARAGEIATMRALGFGATPVALAVAVEGLLLALAGAGIGTAIAYGLFNGVQDISQNTAFHLIFSPAMIALGLAWALMIGLLGGVLPAIHAARLSIVDGLRAS
ncbi:MAG: ABC transporter permease [Alphaproteobacteria bacterium]|nr:ABC transporter permease [Alphaproteobacteria bacterium]